MKTCAQRQLRTKEGFEWIGPKVDMRYMERRDVISRARRLIAAVKPEAMITTDLRNVDGVPEFIIELEKEVYTVIN